MPQQETHTFVQFFIQYEPNAYTYVYDDYFVDTAFYTGECYSFGYISEDQVKIIVEIPGDSPRDPLLYPPTPRYPNVGILLRLTDDP